VITHHADGGARGDTLERDARLLQHEVALITRTSCPDRRGRTSKRRPAARWRCSTPSRARRDRRRRRSVDN
jgi:hypothetical protein